MKVSLRFFFPPRGYKGLSFLSKSCGVELSKELRDPEALCVRYKVLCSVTQISKHKLGKKTSCLIYDRQ